MLKTLKKIALIAMVLPTIAFAKDYPSKMVDFVVPSAAGGSTDTTARLFAEIAKNHMDGLKTQIVNKPGAGGLSGFEYIARSKADGYTVGLVFTPQLVTHIVDGKAKYTLDDFTILGNAADDPAIIVVSAESPIQTLDELIAASKEKKLVASVNGIGSDDFLAAKAFERQVETEFNLVPTKGSTEQKTAILGNHVDVAFMNFSQMLSQHQSGQARILAILTKQRSDHAKDIPTAEEQGLNLYMAATRGFVVRNDTPDEIKQTLEKLVADVLADPEFVEKATQSYIFLSPMSGADYRSYLEELKGEVEAVYAKNPW